MGRKGTRVNKKSGGILQMLERQPEFRFSDSDPVSDLSRLARETHAFEMGKVFSPEEKYFVRVKKGRKVQKKGEWTNHDTFLFG